MWTKSEIPDGWVECNGQNVPGFGNVPDLRGRFVLGAGSPENRNTHNRDGSSNDENSAGYSDDTNYDLGERGGTQKHRLTNREMYNTFNRHAQQQSGFGDYMNKELRAFTEGDAHNNMPPYEVLIYIMKVY